MSKLFFPLIPGGRRKGGICWPKEDLVDRGQALADIGAVVTMDWSIGSGYWGDARAQSARQHGVEFLPMQYGCSVNVDAVQAEAIAYPGSRWLAFNEPDLADCTPELAAEAYHTLYNAVKEVDATARLYGCGTAFYPAHITFHKAFAYAYKDQHGQWPPLDGFHIHSYAKKWDDRFNWQARQDELLQFHLWQQIQPWAKDKPVIISEWGVLSAWWHTGDKQRIADEYIPAMMPWLEAQGWIERHLWFSSWDPYYNASNIFEGDQLTIVGEAWQAHLSEGS